MKCLVQRWPYQCIWQYLIDDIIISTSHTILQDQISEEAVEAEDALGETTGIVHKRLQKMVSTGTVSNNNKPMEKKPLSTVSACKECAMINVYVLIGTAFKGASL